MHDLIFSAVFPFDGPTKYHHKKSNKKVFLVYLVSRNFFACLVLTVLLLVNNSLGNSSKALAMHGLS